MNPSQVEELGQGVFRLHLQVIKFLMIDIRPVVDLHIDTRQAGRLDVRSVGCEIAGNEFIDQRFSLSLSGELQIDDQGEVAHVEGNVDLSIAVDLPPMLRLTPRSVLERTGNQILKGILATMKQRLLRQLAADYERWSSQQTVQPLPSLALGNSTSQTSCLDS